MAKQKQPKDVPGLDKARAWWEYCGSVGWEPSMPQFPNDYDITMTCVREKESITVNWQSGRQGAVVYSDGERQLVLRNLGAARAHMTGNRKVPALTGKRRRVGGGRATKRTVIHVNGEEQVIDRHQQQPIKYHRYKVTAKKKDAVPPLVVVEGLMVDGAKRLWQTYKAEGYHVTWQRWDESKRKYVSATK